MLTGLQSHCTSGTARFEMHTLCRRFTACLLLRASYLALLQSAPSLHQQPGMEKAVGLAIPIGDDRPGSMSLQEYSSCVAPKLLDLQRLRQDPTSAVFDSDTMTHRDGGGTIPALELPATGLSKLRELLTGVHEPHMRLALEQALHHLQKVMQSGASGRLSLCPLQCCCCQGLQKIARPACACNVVLVISCCTRILFDVSVLVVSQAVCMSNMPHLLYRQSWPAQTCNSMCTCVLSTQRLPMTTYVYVSYACVTC